MGIQSDDKAIETRSKELYDVINQPGWKYVEEIILNKIASLDSLSALAGIKPEELHGQMTININVAAMLKEVLQEVLSDAEIHETQKVTEVRLYKSDEFDDL